MNITTKYEINDTVYFVGNGRTIGKAVISEIYIKCTKDKTKISYGFINMSSIEEENLYLSVFDVYTILNSLLLKDVAKNNK